jgi:predicted Zn-dependent peptidase
MLLPLLTATVLAAAAPQPPADSTTGTNPFAGFETHFLPNGVKVWYKRLAGDPVASISVALPVGADADPPGKEQLAHFTEHMLFSDQPGRSEEEIRREIESRGGVYNASVTADRSFYYVRIRAENALFAIEWLARVLGPHAMDSAVVNRQREPVALEVGARPRQFFDWLWAYYLYPPALRMPGFWEREFGFRTRASRDYYPYASLNRIGADDLRAFYEQNYVPALLTLTIIGDVEREAALQAAEAGFAGLAPRPAPPSPYSVSDPGRYRQTVLWAYRPDVYYSCQFKVYEPTADDDLMLIFVAQLLGKRLNDQLRFGERKATYGVRASVVRRGPGTLLDLSGGFRRSEFDFARQLIEDEIEGLRSGSLSEAQFDEDRSALLGQLRVSNAAAEDLERWVSSYFYDPLVHRDYPDLLTAFGALTLAEVQRFTRETLVEERQIVTLIYPLPISQGLLLVLVGLLVGVTVALLRHWLTRPIEMSRIRYVARFHVPRPYLLVMTLIGLAVLAAAGRLLVYAYQWLADAFLLSLDSMLAQWSAGALMLVSLVALTVLVLACLPRKLLVFDDHILIKFLSYRSALVRLNEVEEIAARRFSAVWLSRRLWKCVPLALGIFAPAIYLRRRGGWAYYFDVRDRGELLRTLTELMERGQRAGSATLQPEGAGGPG